MPRGSSPHLCLLLSPSGSISEPAWNKVGEKHGVGRGGMERVIEKMGRKGKEGRKEGGNEKKEGCSGKGRKGDIDELLFTEQVK